MQLIYIGRTPVKLPNADGVWELLYPFSCFVAAHDIYDNRPRLSRVLITCDDYLSSSTKLSGRSIRTLRAWSRYKEIDPGVDLREALRALVPGEAKGNGQLRAEDLGGMTGAQLATVCEELGLPYRGTKAEKRERIEGVLADGG